MFVTVASATDMSLPIRSVSDGDTIGTTLKLPCPLCQASVRINGIDTPESNFLAKCPKERALGIEAKKFLTGYLQGKTTMVVRDVRWDKYGGRILGIVFVDGVNIGDLMIQKGYAKPYFGGTKPDWCV